MKKSIRPSPGAKSHSTRHFRYWWVLTIVSVALVFFLLRPSRPQRQSAGESGRIESGDRNAAPNFQHAERSDRQTRRLGSAHEPAQTPEEIVANKIRQFGKNRREVVEGLAKRFGVEVPDDVGRFFAAIERGNWEEIDAAYRALLLSHDDLNQPRSAELHRIWRPIQEAWGAAREAHNWPAQELLDYGNAILGSLKPGMVYVGGTDPGCFIPTFLNATSDGNPHVTLTQNALADNTYLDYLNFLYGNQMTALTQDDSQRAFQEYITDAQKRYQHDLEFPNEPKQLKPGEDISVVDGKVQVRGQVAVMAINEKLLQTFMNQNPGVSFAIEQSFPLTSTYANATTLGPIMELGVKDPENALTADRAAQSVDYWQATASQLLSNPQISPNSDPLKAYSKLVVDQADLLLNRGYTTQAEQEFQIASQLCPSSPEAVFKYVGLLTSQNRISDALAVVNNAVAADPNSEQFQNLLNTLKRITQ